MGRWVMWLTEMSKRMSGSSERPGCSEVSWFLWRSSDLRDLSLLMVSGRSVSRLLLTSSSMREERRWMSGERVEILLEERLRT